VKLFLFRRRRYDCSNCQDTGWQPGCITLELMVMPVPCSQCAKGMEAREELEDFAESAGLGGLPTPYS